MPNNNSVCKMCLDNTFVFAVQPTISEIPGNQTVTEGGNVTLKCLADGKPTPNIVWTRLSDNSVVIMPLTDIRRQDAGKYRCTADNGIESPATGDVWIAVQCKSCEIVVAIHQCVYYTRKDKMRRILNGLMGGNMT